MSGAAVSVCQTIATEFLVCPLYFILTTLPVSAVAVVSNEFLYLFTLCPTHQLIAVNIVSLPTLYALANLVLVWYQWDLTPAFLAGYYYSIQVASPPFINDLLAYFFRKKAYQKAMPRTKITTSQLGK